MGGLAQRDVVAVLTRAPSAGGKSRLFAELGIPPDAALLTALLLDTIDSLEALTRDGVARVVAVEPAAKCAEVGALVPRDLLVIPQPVGTLGDRMAGVMRALLENGARAVVLVGSDLPTLPIPAVARALALLHDDPRSVVVGPALDGGYYLLAACHVPDLFDDIEWGTSRVLEQTRLRAADRGVPLHLVQPGLDIDSVIDLRRFSADLAHDDPEAAGARTRDWLRTRDLPMGKRPSAK